MTTPQERLGGFSAILATEGSVSSEMTHNDFTGQQSTWKLVLNPKIYLITSNALSNGQQAVQAAHALVQFWVEHREESEWWYQVSNTLALLTVPDESSLVQLLHKAQYKGVSVTPFREPARNNEITAVALGAQGKGLVSKLPLAFTG